MDGRDERLSLLAESLEDQLELGALQGVAACLGNLGVVSLDESKLEEAESLFRESLALRREMGDRGGLATLLECFAGLAALRSRGQRLRGGDELLPDP